MIKHYTFFFLILLSRFAFSSLNKHEAERELALMINLVKHEFLRTEEFRIFGGDLVVVPQIVVSNQTSKYPNANLTPLDENSMGVMVNKALLSLNDDTAILFALAHELGHGFSAAILDRIKCSEISGTATEVVADLGALKLLNDLGLPLFGINYSISNWRKTQIFDLHASGDHPSGSERYRLIAMAIRGLATGINFLDVVNYIIRIELKAPCKNLTSHKRVKSRTV